MSLSCFKNTIWNNCQFSKLTRLSFMEHLLNPRHKSKVNNITRIRKSVVLTHLIKNCYYYICYCSLNKLAAYCIVYCFLFIQELPFFCLDAGYGKWCSSHLFRIPSRCSIEFRPEEIVGQLSFTRIKSPRSLFSMELDPGKF